MGIRIIAPIPGKGTIGMEVPNKKPRIVSMLSILSSRAYRESKAQLPIALGCTISNDVYVTDLAKCLTCLSPALPVWVNQWDSTRS